jgi:dipeptidyl aminopeptidase/acylaminoacyl peptidase
MRRTTSLLLSIALLGCAQNANHEAKQYTIEQFINTTAMSGSSFSADGSRLLFSSDRSGVFNAYVIPVEGGEPTQLTHSDTSAVFILGFFPEDDRILVRSDLEGNEQHHLYVLEANGAIRDLTAVPGSRAEFYGWTDDGKSFVFGWNRRDGKFMDIYAMDLGSLSATLLYQNDQGLMFGDLSGDRRFLALSKTITQVNTDIYLYDLAVKSLTNITKHEGSIVHTPEAFSADSKTLYYLTDDGDEFRYLARYDLASGKKETLEKPGWDVMYAFESHKGKYRVIGVNKDAGTEVRITDLTTGTAVALPTLPDGDIVAPELARSEKLLAFYVNGPRSPSDLYVYDFAANSHRKLAESLNQEIDPQDLVDAERVRYTSFDGLEIPALLYKPHGLGPGERMPAVVNVHGGPGGQARVNYSSSIQYLVNHGYVVIDVNNRGSSGYGKTFFTSDDQKHGEEDLGDCVAAKAFLANTGYVDTSKVAIMGGSYGGYMVLAALTFRPTEFAAGVDYFGISNWVRTLENIPPWWESFREALYVEMGNPATQKDYLHRISPLFHSKNIQRPLMVLQGANDPRVLKPESDDIVAAVKANGVPVEYIVFDDEGHGFTKKKNRIEGTRAVLEFLDEHLKGATGPSEPVAARE